MNPSPKSRISRSVYPNKSKSGALPYASIPAADPGLSGVPAGVPGDPGTSSAPPLIGGLVNAFGPSGQLYFVGFVSYSASTSQYSDLMQP